MTQPTAWLLVLTVLLAVGFLWALWGRRPTAPDNGLTLLQQQLDLLRQQSAESSQSQSKRSPTDFCPSNTCRETA
ncbi:MAG TPA: hypothetical protein PKX64_09335, partial [Elusimicrobiota bacterium]|nr:hypothetical protein [Elusimicrobiota bacterium]